MAGLIVRIQELSRIARLASVRIPVIISSLSAVHFAILNSSIKDESRFANYTFSCICVIVLVTALTVLRACFAKNRGSFQELASWARYASTHSPVIVLLNDAEGSTEHLCSIKNISSEAAITSVRFVSRNIVTTHAVFRATLTLLIGRIKPGSSRASSAFLETPIILLV